MATATDALDRWNELAEYEGLLDAIRRGVAAVEVVGLAPAAAVALAAAVRRHLRRPVVILAPDWPAAQAAAEAAELWLGGAGRALFFPPRDFLPFAVVAQSPEVAARRLATLTALVEPGASGGSPLLVLPVSALRRMLPPPAVFRDAVLRLAVGQAASPQQLAAALARAGYERQAVVEGPGSFAARGGIVDVFPLTAPEPVRVELDETSIVSLRTFAVEHQRSTGMLQQAVLPPAREVPIPTGEQAAQALGAIRAALHEVREGAQRAEEARQRLELQVQEDLEGLESGTAPHRWEAYLPFAYPPTSVLRYLALPGERPPVCVVLGTGAVEQAQRDVVSQEQGRLSSFLAEGRILPLQAQAFAQPDDWLADLGRSTVLFCDALGGSGSDGVQEHIAMAARPVPSFGGQWTLALDTLRRWQQGGYRVLCWVGGAERVRWLVDTLREGGVPAVADPEGRASPAAGAVHVAAGALPAGFELPGARLVVLGDAELLGRRPRAARLRRASTAGPRLQSYEDLQVGDYVVHAAHGVGQYLGTVALTVQGKVRDYLVLRYEGTDRLYVPTDQIGQVQKYVGAEGRAPRLSRLGGGEWARAKQRVRESVRHMAEELLALYAARQTLQGHAFSPDGLLHREFADAFPFEETPDQAQAIAEIAQDMERPVPMDRLLCGDVGYGKTEVAMRAAFKAVVDGRQVAVLVPTTILAEQHYLTFSERFKGFPVQIRMLSRFRSRKEQEEAITALRRGAVDIVIGTHRLLQADVGFKNLGLLIIDEEHRFGVAHKERLKQLRQTVDVLSMTATPIPRTMHMALAGIRDMSVINTPPENRYPVETVVVEWSPTLIREALQRELARGGQVYYLHNRVQSIGAAYERLRELAPEADIVVAHGQMAEDELERVMTEFWRGEHQILLATTIIESGLDIPNANTVIVEDADKFGLAQLYQIRGRVGRSSRVAYAYFTYRRERRLSELAERRLEALKAFTELGSGYRIALRDLEIRGAGNLLGPEQHGFVAAVGFELYAQLLEEAVRELKGEREVPSTRPTVELSVDAYIDDAYIAEPRVKLEFYKKIHAAASPEDLRAVEEELRDRFGPHPQGVDHLLRLARIRLAAQAAGLLGVVQDGQAVVFTFPAYAGEALPRLLNDLGARFPRRLGIRPGARPALRLALDARDDATVLGSVEACLQALRAHPQVQRWSGQAAEPGPAEPLSAPAPPEPAPTPAPVPTVPATDPAVADGAAAAQPSWWEEGTGTPDRLARRLGLERVQARPAGPVRPGPVAPPAAARRGTPLRPVLPPGLLPGGGAAPRRPPGERR